MIYLYSLVIIALIQGVFFLGASYFKTDKVTDLAYGMTFAGLMTWLFFAYGSSSVHALVFVLVALWGIRLAGYLFMRILIIKKDGRFDGIRENKKSFGKFWLLQGVAIFTLLLPVLIVYTKEGLNFHRISLLGCVVGFAGICIESLADRQKFSYKRQNPKHRVDTGLRAKARHPNYFGEMLVWRGIYIACLPYLSGYEYVSIVSPFMITWLLLFVTGIPPLKEQWERKYGHIAEFKDWKERTRLLFPWGH